MTESAPVGNWRLERLLSLLVFLMLFLQCSSLTSDVLYEYEGFGCLCLCNCTNCRVEKACRDESEGKKKKKKSEGSGGQARGEML